MGNYNSTWYCFECHTPLLENEIYEHLEDDEAPYCPNCKSKLIDEIGEETYKQLKQKKFVEEG